ncbi:MAG: hypothetical protein IPK16_28755 [Anaerolineales bacterium]|nr:hypothetical protein [Anaerolineales bacterium]
MKIHNLFRQFWRRKPHPSPDVSSASMHQMHVALSMVAQTQAQELSCDEVYALLDIFADRVKRGEDAAALMPLVHQHLAMCPDCREEFEALLRAMEAK